ncbi:MAG: hypothetical protein PHX83_00125 [Acidobacteriia bacterium]|nr:hypothetical protein [Terriglobia bacterium]
MTSSIRRGLVAFTILLVMVSSGHLQAADSPIDLQLAAQYFDEAHTLCTQDGGHLWGISLCGPMLFIEGATRYVVANEAGSEGLLTPQGNVFTGTWPRQMMIANTAIDWSGKRWTMVLWPLPPNRAVRYTILMHESFHRIQKQLGLPLRDPLNPQMDTTEGRMWLRLEWRALETALRSTGEAKKDALRDALLFRAYRRFIFPPAAATERPLEMSEGLAEYTGVALSGRSNLADHAADTLKNAEQADSLARSFAYASGPAYGILLDQSGKSWRNHLRADDDFGTLVASTYSLEPPVAVKESALLRAKLYDGPAIREAENHRTEDKEKIIIQWRHKLVEGPVLKIPLQNMKMEFNPNKIVSLGEQGTVYPTIRIVDHWGILTVSDGALMSPQFGSITVSAPSDPVRRPLTGSGWQLELNPGWIVVADKRPGDFTVKPVSTDSTKPH